MAINLFEKQCDKINSKYISNGPRGNALPSRQLVQLSIVTDGSITSSDGKSIKTKKISNSISPYLTGDSVRLLSRITEKKLYSQHKKSSDVVPSSFPLAVNIYKANSDEFKAPKKGIKKVKKSVLTLPNAPTAEPQICTVSDMNDSEYYNKSEDNRKMKTKKRFVTPTKKSRTRNKDYEFYDRDARYCSQMNINLDCSSTDMINQFTGDGNSIAGRLHAGKAPQNKKDFNAHDVWAVLRNINRFQFRPSPPISEDSIHSPKKKKSWNRRRNNRKDRRVIETCRTEEFAYISSYELDGKSPKTFSQSSSFDRITVIDKQDEFSEICNKYENKIIKKDVKVCPNVHKNLRRKNTKNYLKAFGHTEQDEVNGPQSNFFNRIINTRDKKGLEERNLKGNNYESPRTLVAMNDVSKEVNSSKHFVNDFKNQDKFEDVSVIVDRANEYAYSLCSDSSKVGITTASKDNNDTLLKVSSDESGPRVKGITKVVLSKGQSLLTPKIYETLKRKPRLASNMPSTMITMPKLTQADIKRRTANLKFPIVILGKDQLSSASFQVMNNDPPYLEGLKQSIWPFMQDWYDQTNLKRDSSEKNKKAVLKYNSPRNKNQANEHKSKLHIISEVNTNNKLSGVVEFNSLRHKHQVSRSIVRNVNKVNENKESTVGDKNCLKVENASNKKKSPKRPLPPNEITKVKPQQTKKAKPIYQLKDKMIKLLYKNSSAKDIDVQYKTSDQEYTNNDTIHAIEAKISNDTKTVDIGTETLIKYEFGPVVRSNDRPKTDSKKMQITKQPWAKAKWASDFIETVINKIRSGIYFNQESKQKIPQTDLKDASIQTILSGKMFCLDKEFVNDKLQDNAYSKEVVHYEKEQHLETLLGFNDSLPALEIKTLNMKEVAVKYCTTNVMVQFDVAVPSCPENVYSLKKSSSFVPLAITDSHTKIFKCKTTIVNAMLPAEICSLLPKIIRSIIDLNKTPPFSPTKFQNESLLYTITELSHCESTDILKSEISSPMPTTNLSPAVFKLLNGVFCSKEIVKISINRKPKLSYNYIITQDLLLNISVQQLLALNLNPISCGIRKPDLIHTIRKNNSEILSSTLNNCTALDIYRERKPMMNIMLCNNSSSVLEKLWRSKENIRFKISKFPFPLDATVDYKITVSFNNIMNDAKQAIDGMSTVTGKFTNYSLCNVLMKHNNTIPLKAIEYKHHSETKPINKKEVQNHNILVGCHSSKTRKKSFIKLYKKCKSTSNISGERFSTPLSKIVSLDDFFQAMGSGKLLSSVFDGLTEKKILSSIIEMKSWITDISQRQAMLILLLTNKKDTTNLVRFRPILLQGIAVNRITRAAELDMEIEVIEREHFNKFSQYEGIPCLKESIENRNSLMEELYWIAKTTASDYQRPFNEVSEKLLKSLLEKRKKLNPSYLRVMARYVGLGLLKSPKP